jgi:hypothetical protein
MVLKRGFVFNQNHDFEVQESSPSVMVIRNLIVYESPDKGLVV